MTACGATMIGTSPACFAAWGEVTKNPCLASQVGKLNLDQSKFKITMVNKEVNAFLVFPSPKKIKICMSILEFGVLAKLLLLQTHEALLDQKVQ